MDTRPFCVEVHADSAEFWLDRETVNAVGEALLHYAKHAEADENGGPRALQLLAGMFEAAELGICATGKAATARSETDPPAEPDPPVA